MREISKDALKANILQLAKENGWMVDEYAGFQDAIMVHPDKGVIFAVIKQEKGILRTDQKLWIDRLRAAGQDAVIWRPSDRETIERRIAG